MFPSDAHQNMKILEVVGSTFQTLLNPTSEIDKIFKADYYEDDSGIENVFSNGVKKEIDLNSPYHVYNLEGVCVSQSISSLKPGIYIVRQGNLTKKWLVSSGQR